MYSMLQRVVLVLALVLADLDVSEGAVLPGPLGGFR